MRYRLSSAALLCALLLCAAGPAAAQVTVSPPSLEAALAAGSSTTLTLAVENPGPAAVEARLRRRAAGSAGAGVLYAVSRAEFGIVRLDPQTGATLAGPFQTPRSSGSGQEGLAFDGEALYWAPGGIHNALYKLDPETGAVLGAMRLPYGVFIDGLAHTGSALYASDPQAFAIYEIDFEAGAIVRTLTPGVGIIGGLTAGGSRGTLFVSSNNDAGIYEIDPATGAIVNTVPVTGFLIGLAYSEELELLFVFEQLGPSSGRLFVVDPDTGVEVAELPTDEFEVMGSLAADEGVGVARWLSLAPAVTTVPASGTALVEVTLDAAALTAGEYTAEIAVFSGEGQLPDAVVPVTLSVSGAPAITPEPGVLAFGSVVAGATAERTLTIRNTGTDLLTVSMVGATSPDVSVEPGGFTLAPGAVAQLAVALTPGASGPVAAEVILNSDDPSQPTLSVPVTATALPAPALALDPATLTVTADAGDTVTATLTLTNAGPGALEFEAFGGSAGLLAPGRETPVGYLPTFLTDPAGDATGGGPDLVAIRARAINDTLHVELEFVEEIGIDDQLFAALFLDTDQNVATGRPPRFELPHVLGYEIEVYFDTDFSRVTAQANFDLPVPGGMYPLHFEGNRLRFGLPLADIGAPDGQVDVIGVVGSAASWLSDRFPVDRAASLGGLPWLDLAPASGSVPAGASVDVTVTLDASDFIEGVYEASLLLRTNDPAAAGVIVPVTFEVDGTPAIAVDPAALEFGGVFVGGSAEQTLLVINPGTAPLAVSGIQSSTPGVSASPMAFTLAPGDTTAVTVTFAPAEVGSVSATLTIQNDSPDQPELVVAVAGEGLPAPVVGVEPSAIEVTLTQGEETTETLTLTNTGGSPLTYTISSRAGIASGARPTRGGELPILIEDPEGDVPEDARHDVIALRGRSFDGQLQLQIDFADDVDADWLNGFLWLDVDEDPTTGEVPGWAHPDQEIGMEYEISLGDVFAGFVVVRDLDFNTVGEYPVEVEGNALRFSIPLADLGDDDGQMRIAGVLIEGGFIGSTPIDWFPDAGFATVGGVSWLTVTPESGTIAPGQSAELALTLSAADLEVGTHTATVVVSTNDPATTSVDVPVTFNVGAVSTDPSAVPLAFAFHPGYPNPVRSSARLAFDLPEPTFVEMQVFDVQGRLVRTLVQEERPAGRHEVTLGIDGIASGVYLCRIQAGAFTATQRLIVVR